MITILLLIITIILGSDFYITHKKLVKKTINSILKRKNKTEFIIKTKGVGDKIAEELNKNSLY